MKLVRYSMNGSSPRLGLLLGDEVRDLADSYARDLSDRGVYLAGELAQALFSGSTRRFLQAGAVATDAIASIEGAVRAGRLAWVTHPLKSVRLHAPISDPEKLICIGLNYKDHAAEAGLQPPKEPPLFAKWPNAIIDPGDPILRPRGSTQLDYEVELGVVIGKTARYVTEAEALDYVFGYTIVHDVSARDFQLRTSQWMAGKIPDSFAPIGPWIADRAEIPDPYVLDLGTWVNGSRLQHGNTRDMIFNVNYLVSFLSRLITLVPGDVIATGTPAGVGFVRKPPVFLMPGDTVRMEITGLGVLENPIKDA